VSEGWTLDRVEREFILRMMKARGGNVAKTATALGIDRRTLFRKLRQYKDHGLLPKFEDDAAEPTD
jgi:transcriptional regulator of acetoin/glycerol metabolism